MNETLPEIPPHNLEAEQSILGAILLDPAALAVASEHVATADFYRQAHQHIFSAMQRLLDRG